MNTKRKTTHIHNNTNQPSHQKIANTKEYNDALSKRGDFTFFLDQAIKDNATKKPMSRHTRGRQYKYSDALIKLILIYREIYSLSLRQAVCFTTKVLHLAGFYCAMPNFTTVSRRIEKVRIDIIPEEYYLYRHHPICLLVDSSGFKVHGEGEWVRRKHGMNKHREWQTTHIGVDLESRIILGVVNTLSNVHDNTELIPILLNVDRNSRRTGVERKLETVIGDGAYENHNNYHLARDLKITIIAPPQKNAAVRVTIAHEKLNDVPGWEDRNRVIETIARVGGLEVWKKKVGYHRRSLVENAFYRLKYIFSNRMANRTENNRYQEQLLRVMILNQFTMFGLPKYK